MSKELEELDALNVYINKATIIYNGETYDLSELVECKKKLKTENTELKVRNEKLEEFVEIVNIFIDNNCNLLLSNPPKYQLTLTLSEDDYWKFKKILEENKKTKRIDLMQENLLNEK